MAKVLNFKVIIEQDEDGYFVANVPAIPGCHTQGKSYEQVVERVKEVIELCLEEAKDNPKYRAKINFEDVTQEKFLGITQVPVLVTL